MNIVAIEAPAARVALPGETLELVNAFVWVVAACQGLQVIADELIQTFPQSLGFLAGASYCLLVDGEGNIH